ncbi:hypothetical protein KY284_007933 [Solanum tuberosum]|nr:hypothetical protein KY284_007933 [Solanum tuberosum]
MEQPVFTKEQYGQILRLLNKKKGTEDSTVNMTSIAHAYLVDNKVDYTYKQWIVDSGTSKHITSDLGALFDTYVSHKAIKSKFIYLMAKPPQFLILESINGMDLSTWKVKGIGKESGGLYVHNDGAGVLCHKRLGHPSINVLMIISLAVGGHDNTRINAQKIFVSGDVVVHENVFPFKIGSSQCFCAPTSLPTIPVHFDEDENSIVGLGTHANSNSSDSGLVPDSEASEPVVETSFADEMNFDHAPIADVDDDHHILEVVPELPVATPAPRRSTRGTATPTWHQDYHWS